MTPASVPKACPNSQYPVWPTLLHAHQYPRRARVAADRVRSARSGALAGRTVNSPQDQVIDAAIEGEDVELSRGILTEGRDIQPRAAVHVDQFAVGDGSALLLAEAPDPAGFVVAVDVHADQLGQVPAAIDIAAGDALAVVGAPGAGLVGVVGILDDRLGERRGGVFLLAGAERVEALHDAPAVIAAVLDDVDGFPEILAHVARPEPAGLAVEGDLPGVAQANGVDLGCPVGELRVAQRRVVLGDAIGLAAGGVVDVDPQDRAEPVSRVLPGRQRVVGRSTVA